MSKRKVKINYLAKDIDRSNGAEFTMISFYAVSVDRESTKRYHNTIGVLMKLGKCARMLLDFVVENMNNKSFINNNTLFKKEFNDLLKSTGQKPYSGVTINKAFSELCFHSLLDNRKNKGTYQVNPVFFFNGSELDREKLIRKGLEYPNRELIANYRREHYLEEESED